jgi:hypothetical protein
VQPTAFRKQFLQTSPAGWFKAKDPTVTLDRLQKKWVDGTDVLYIGKAGRAGGRATLRSRIQCYLEHGAGRPVAHWGGRYVWQLAKSDELLVAWREEPDDSAAAVESALIDQFYEEYGRLPFANLRK